MVPKKERRGIIGPWVFQRLSTTFSFLILMLGNSVFWAKINSNNAQILSRNG